MLGWRLEASFGQACFQVGYELQVAANVCVHLRHPRDIGHFYIASPSPIGAPWPEPIAAKPARRARVLRVRAWTDRGQILLERALARREAGMLLEAGDWTGRPISPLGLMSIRSIRRRPAPCCGAAFTLDQAVASARLYVTALGVHDTTLNGERVSDALLEPGWTAYRKRLLYAAHDVTGLLQVGENVLSAAVADGWWRGGLTWLERRAVYGKTTALMAQLEIHLADGSALIVSTDESWRGGTGAVRSADLYNGTDVDLRLEPAGWREPGFDDTGWEGVETLPLPAGLEIRSPPPVRVVEVRTVEPRRLPDGVLQIDAGQNLTGHLRLSVQGPAGGTLRVRHAEVLDDSGRLYTAALRNAKATDTYTLADAEPVTLEPPFTFHGFRYAEIEASEGVEVTAVDVMVVSSDLPQIGEFECSDARVNRLFENVRWSQRGNFLSVPTDCPQRDERLGWTGDILVFAPAACSNADADAFLASWLIELALDQRDGGAVSSVVPNVLGGGRAAAGACGWGDAATIVPWRLYEAYGAVETLRRQYSSMRAWVDFCASRRDESGLDRRLPVRRLARSGRTAGSPGQATTEGDYIATAYLSFSAGLLSKIAGLLGDSADVARYSDLSEATAAVAWARWREHALTTQAGCAVAVELGIAPEAEIQSVSDALAALVDAAGGRIATGFLGTPLVLPALCRGGHFESAYRVLMNPECPGWLYQVLAGATTMWERWDAIKPGGRVQAGEMGGSEGMLSFNHYAYGAVGAWLYRTVAGLAPASPGYAEILFAPIPGGGLDHARAAIATPFGRAAIAWRLRRRLAIDLPCHPARPGLFVAPPGDWRASLDGVPTDFGGRPRAAPA